MTNPLRKVQWFADWLDEREASRQVRKLREMFAPLLAKAKDEKNWNKRDELNSEWGLELNLVIHPVYARKAEKLVANARKYGITVPPQPANFADDSEHWTLSTVYGFWLPTRELEERLRRDITS
jgi:DUF438 domain-containing protein